MDMSSTEIAIMKGSSSQLMPILKGYFGISINVLKSMFPFDIP